MITCMLYLIVKLQQLWISASLYLLNPLVVFILFFLPQIQIINVQIEKKTARAKTISFSLGESHHSHSANSNKNRRKIPYNPCPPSHW